MKRFITFEGIDGSGKTTLISSVATELAALGREVFCTKAPGGTWLGDQIRSIVLESDQKITPLSELFLFLSDRAESAASVIVPALLEGKIVLCDRFHDSTVAYQSVGRGIDAQWIMELCLFAAQGLKPTLTFCLDISPEEAEARNPKKKDRIEKEGLEFHRKIRSGFLQIAQSDSNRVKVLDATKPKEVLVRQVVDQIVCLF